MKIDFQVQGLEQLRRTGKQFSGRLDTELKPAVRDTAQEVRDRARNKARVFSIGGFYPAAIRSQVQSGGLVAFVGSIAKTTLSIEEGRKGGELVKFGLILRWVRRRGISIPAITRKGANGEAQLARQIIAGIRAHGTKPLPHLVPAAQEAKDGWQRRVRASVQTALKTVKGA